MLPNTRFCFNCNLGFKLEYDELFSNFDYNFTVRPCIQNFVVSVDAMIPGGMAEDTAFMDLDFYVHIVGTVLLGMAGWRRVNPGPPQLLSAIETNI